MYCCVVCPEHLDRPLYSNMSILWLALGPTFFAPSVSRRPTHPELKEGGAAHKHVTAHILGNSSRLPRRPRPGGPFSMIFKVSEAFARRINACERRQRRRATSTRSCATRAWQPSRFTTLARLRRLPEAAAASVPWRPCYTISKSERRPHAGASTVCTAGMTSHARRAR